MVVHITARLATPSENRWFDIVLWSLTTVPVRGRPATRPAATAIDVNGHIAASTAAGPLGAEVAGQRPCGAPERRAAQPDDARTTGDPVQQRPLFAHQHHVDAVAAPEELGCQLKPHPLDAAEDQRREDDGDGGGHGGARVGVGGRRSGDR